MAPAIYHQLVANAIAETYEGNLDISSNQLRRTALTDRKRIFRGSVSTQPRDRPSLRPTPTAPQFAKNRRAETSSSSSLRISSGDGSVNVNDSYPRAPSCSITGCCHAAATATLPSRHTACFSCK